MSVHPYSYGPRRTSGVARDPGLNSLPETASSAEEFV